MQLSGISKCYVCTGEIINAKYLRDLKPVVGFFGAPYSCIVVCLCTLLLGSTNLASTKSGNSGVMPAIQVLQAR